MYRVQNETVVENVSIQAIEADGAIVSVGGFALDPAPFVSLSIDQYRSGDLIVGGVLNVSLNGTVYDNQGGGFSAITDKIQNLLDNIGSKGDCVHVLIDCSGTKLVDGYGTITGLDVNEGPDPTWTQLAVYGINLQLHVNHDELVVKPNTLASDYILTDEIIKDLSENISMSVDEDTHAVDTIMDSLIVGRSHVKHNFTISAKGGAVGCKGMFTQKTGIEAAELVAKRRIAALRNGDLTTGIADATYTGSDLDYYHSGNEKYTEIRTLDVDPISGSVSVTGSLILRPSSITHKYALVEITTDHSTDVSRIGTDINISGNIEGLGLGAFNADSLALEEQFHSANKNKIENAELAYEDIKSKLVEIAQAHLDGVRDTTSCTEGSLLDICPLTLTDLECDTPRINNISVSRNYGQGTISFSADLSTAKNCDIAGAAKVEIDVTHTYGAQQFAEFTIPFRGEPLLQNLGTNTKEVVSVSVDLTFGDTGCNDLSNHSVINNAISCARDKAIEAANNEGASGWYLTSDTVKKTNTGQININLEYTKPYDC